MIEALIKELIAALNANTAAHGGAAVETSTTAADTAATTTTTAAAGKTKPAAGKTKPAAAAVAKGPTREEVVALLTKIKDEHGAAEAKPLVALAGVVKMAEIPDNKLQLVFDAATKKLAGEEEAEGEDDGDL